LAGARFYRITECNPHGSRLATSGRLRSVYRNATVSQCDRIVLRYTPHPKHGAGADISISTGIAAANACAGKCDARSITRYPLQEEFP